MALSYRYKLYFTTLCVFLTFSLKAQYSEEDLRNDADALFEKQQYAEAMSKYAQLLSLNPTKPEFNYKYGATALYGDPDKKEEAIKYLRFASTKPGVDNKVWYFLGRAYHLNYRFADAADAYRKYISLADRKEAAELQVQAQLDACQNGQNLLSKIKDVKVLDKKESLEEAFFRIYDLSEIGGKILVTPEELLSSLDKKKNHRSLIHFRGQGTTVYFSSYGNDESTGLDIFSAQVLPDGSFSKPQKLPGSINTVYDEDYPFLHPDNKTFFFSSKGHSSMGGFDIFRASFDQGSGVFSNPENLDFAVNTPDDELFYIADSSMNLANFASARSSVQGYVHVYRVKVQSAPLDLTLIKGTFFNRINSANKLVKITVVNAATNQEVDVQFSDPQSGDYVLSFPKSGKYKFLVEADKSDRIHAGTVDIPKSSGIKAFLQEMELVSSAGVEKLLINNLFDQTFEGDVTALAQELLRKKAALEINFNPEEEIAPIEEPVEELKDPALAYNAAGFGAGMSNQKVLEQAKERTTELNKRLDQLAALESAAKNSYAEKLAAAGKKASEAQDLVDRANASNGDARSKLMFEAGIAKSRAERALLTAANAADLSEELEAMRNTAREDFEASRTSAELLEKALESNNYDQALAALKEEKQRREAIDQVGDRFDPVNEIRRISLDADKDAKKQIERAGSIRAQAETAQSKLVTLRRQRENAKGKAANELDAEITRAEAEAQDLALTADKLYSQAEMVQEEARNKQMQYEMVSGMYSNLSEYAGAADKASVQTEPALYTQSEKAIENIEIDQSEVAAYVSKNPESLSALASESEILAFRKTYSIETGSESPLADQSEEVATVRSSEEEDLLAENMAPNAPEPQIAENPQAENPQAENPQAENQGEANSAIAINQESQEAVELIEAIPSKTSEEIAPVKENEVNTMRPEESGLADNSNALKASSSLQDVNQENIIKAEEIKIEAAEDWIAIIDASIIELENGVGGDNEEEGSVADQLKQYQKLKEAKLKEIADSKKIIKDLEIAAEKSLAENSGATNLAVDRAMADIDSLSPSLIARLESKIADSYTEVKYMKDLRAIDRDYLPKMASIELAGKSDPEIASERIALNKALIKSLDQLISGNAISDVPVENLLEIRRLKSLEIREDEAVQIGSAAYKPRTAEAVEYASLIAPVDESATETKEPKSDPIPNISPQMAQELKEPFSRDAVMPGYADQMEALGTSELNAEDLGYRISLNKAYLTELQSSIQLYAAYMAQGSNEEVKSRYNQLLSDRLTVVDEIDADKAQVKALSEVTAEATPAKTLEISEPTEADIDANPTMEDLSTDRTDEVPATDPVAQDETINPNSVQTDLKVENTSASDKSEFVSPTMVDYVSRFDSTFTAQQVLVKSAGLNPEEEMAQMAEVNRNLASDIDAVIIDLVAQMDKSQTDALKDSLQLQIQRLDAIAADKRQEADRLITEIELLAVNAISVENSNVSAPTKDSGIPATVLDEPSAEDLPEIVEIILPQENIKYKSLNANISYNALQLKLDSVESLKSEGIALQKDYSSAKSLEEREAIKTRIDQINSRMVVLSNSVDRELMESNAAEIAFFRSMNDEALSNLSASQNTNPELTAQISALSERTALLNNDLLENERALQQGLIDREEALARELSLIAELADLNSDLKTVEEELISEDSSLSTVNPVSEENRPQVSTSLSVRINNPDNYRPEPNKKYITPIRRSFVEEISDERKAEIIRNDAELQVSSPIEAGASKEAKGKFLMGATGIDEAGLKLLNANPNAESYLLASVLSDSLKTLESAKSSYADELETNAKEKIVEAERLENMILHQESERDKAILREKRKKLLTEAEVQYQKAGIAAVQAEEIRELRSQQQLAVAESVKKLSAPELAELNAVLKNEPYVIIPVDLASVSPVERAEKVEPTVKTPTPVSKPDENEVALNTDLKGIDESVLKESKGNWLSVVEIIANKKDFSDVSETLFVGEGTKAVYSKEVPIPIDPPMPSGLVFQVQVGAFRNPIPQDVFGEFAPIMGQKLPNGITRYRAGIFRTYRSATEARDKIRSKGYEDAFVVAYVDGERLTGEQAQQILAQAREIEATEPSATEVAETRGELAETAAEKTAITLDELPAKVDYYNDPEAAEAMQVEVTPGLFFTVQVGVYSKPVKLGELYDLVELNSELTSSGTIRYTSGRYSSIESASERKLEAIGKGVGDAFITAYYNGKRIGLAEAKAILEKEGQDALSPNISSAVTPTESPAANAEIESNDNFVVIMDSSGGDIPQKMADLIEERPDLEIRQVVGPNGMAIYVSKEFETKEQAKAFLELSKKAGIASAVIGRMQNGSILGVEAE